ncbi:MAG: NHL repeat-containing protein [Myxococcales bacterium]
MLLAGQLGGGGNGDGVGTSARFEQLAGLATDGHTLYVVDGNAIRQVDLSGGTVRLLAGNIAESGSTDGVGAAARFSRPRGLALDGAGDLLVADTYNLTIRKIDLTTGQTTTLAGQANTASSSSVDGIGASARFVNPTSLAADGHGRLFVVDDDGFIIREVDLATADVTTLAGTDDEWGVTDGLGPAARFDGITALSLDSSGNLLVADDGPDLGTVGAIRQVDLATGSVTTLYGWTPALWDLSGLIIDAQARMFATNAYDSVVLEINRASGSTSIAAGISRQPGSADGLVAGARLVAPEALAVDAAGRLLVGDWEAVRVVDLDAGEVSTLAGLDPHVGAIDGIGEKAQFDAPGAVAQDDAGRLFVADVQNGSIRTFDLSSTAVTTLLGPDAGFYSIDGLAADGQGNLYLSDNWFGSVSELELTTGRVTALVQNGIDKPYGPYGPGGLALDGRGHLFVSDYCLPPNDITFAPYHGSSVDVVDLSSLAVSQLADGTNQSDAGVPFDSPDGLAYDGAGHLFVADSGNSAIRLIDVATGVVSTVAGSLGVPGHVDGIGPAARFVQPIGLALDGLGHLYVTDPGDSTVRRIDLATGAVVTWAGQPGQAGVQPGPLPARLNQPLGIAVAPTGAILLTDQAENGILAVEADPTGT